MEKFVVVNGRILDFEKYKEDFSAIKKIVSLDMKEYFVKLGFKQVKPSAKQCFRKKLKFYNAELDLEIIMKINKKQRLRFI